MKYVTTQSRFEWPTWLALITCYGAWLALGIAGDGLHPAIWIIAIGVLSTFYWSLVHEVIHGHPTKNQTLNELLVALPLGWLYPVGRFRDTHLTHHQTGELTDPFDDPESWYLAGPDWQKSAGISRSLLRFNNTLLGRMLIGPFIVASRFLHADIKAMIAGDKTIIIDWSKHLIACAVLASILIGYSEVPFWQWAVAAYIGISLLLIRTFLEHQATEDHGERTVIIEGLCPLAFLFLYNNLHCVHHMRPLVPWYQLPAIYRENREKFTERNRGYVYRSYSEVFRRYFFSTKEPVSHPFL